MISKLTHKQSFWISQSGIGASIIARFLKEENKSYKITFSKEIIDLIEMGEKDSFSPTPDQKILNFVMLAFFDKTYPASKASDRTLPIMKWIVDRYLNETHNGQQILAEDLSKIGQDIQYLNGLRHSGQTEYHVTDFKTLAALREFLQPYEARRILKEEISRDRSMPAEQKNAIMSGTTILYNGPEGKIVVAHTLEASQYWGNGTKWCISGEKTGPHTFDNYNEKSAIIMLLPKNADKTALVDQKFYDSQDKASISTGISQMNLWNAMIENQPSLEHLNRFLPNPSKQLYSHDSYEDLNNLVFPWDMKLDDQIWVLKLCSYESQSETFPSTITRNDNIMECAIRNSPWALAHAPPKYRYDKDVILQAVKERGFALQYASPELRKNREIVLAAIESDPDAFKFADKSLQKDREIILRAFLQDYDDPHESNGLLRFVDKSLLEDREIVLAAVRQNGHNIAFAAKFKTDKEMVIEAVTKNHYAIEEVDQSFLSDRDVALACVKRGGYSIKYFNNDIRKDREFCRLAFDDYIVDYDILRCIHDDLQKDLEFVVRALNKSLDVLREMEDISCFDSEDFLLSLLDYDPDISFKVEALYQKSELVDNDIACPIDPSVIFEYKIKAIRSLIKEDRIDEAASRLRFIEALWGQSERIFGDPVEQLFYLESFAAQPMHLAPAP